MIDYNFIVDVFQRYSKHLEDVIESINSYMANYDKQEIQLKKLVEFKPSAYQKRLEEVQQKKVEADIKLSLLIPRMAKMATQIEEIKQAYKIEI